MILVTGATGLVGTPLTELLARRGAKVRAVSRDPKAVVPQGVALVTGDPAKPDTIAEALDGVTALFLHPRAVGDAADALAALARRRGVSRIVALSATNVDDPLDEQPSRVRGDRNREAEDAAVAHGREWTSIRVGYFALNALTSWGGQIHNSDVVRGPYADFAVAPIHERDIAAVAAHALLTPDLVGRKVNLSGPAILRHADMVATIGTVLNRPLRYQEIPPEAAARALTGAGLPESLANAFVANYTRDWGLGAMATGEVERILGRGGLTFADWVADHADAFAAPTAAR
ncbi:NAD(P)H-binding protein [Stackebrandtia nassauensis]|uniref:NmrA family protein n=1 Tax=Stackebrandtia nassauensis (strain DSM 44728 / CIP 108903 / NRRL B-16338 / NBRC 102104 / LLR-40K-21) TaxID=446470 RepID=D3PUC1_STANL|nr:NAD(P)H-binding protein [Stackebrandtia nassauensis]ADD41067.1 NmrA family protein [Stackebrandtia nassauensis DSM 44728]